MTLFSYHASHEQFSPRDLLTFVREAEAAGFEAVFSSDHLQPWAPPQGHSGFVWSWLGAAMQATARMPFGLITVPGGWRYHPVVLAQAIATLGQMYPGRLPWVAVGSGEAINEATVGGAWPEKWERNERLKEGAAIVRSLLAGETVTRHGRLSAVDARIWSRPEGKPTQLVGAAVSERTAEWLGSWADGLLTVRAAPDKLQRMIDAFRRGGGEGKPIHLKVDVSWAPTYSEALRQAHEQWRFNVLGGDANWELRKPQDFETAARFVRPDDMAESVLVASDLGQMKAWLDDYASMGFASIDIHNVGRNQQSFIEAFGRHVLPELAR